jgi:hypothetical protein
MPGAAATASDEKSVQLWCGATLPAMGRGGAPGIRGGARVGATARRAEPQAPLVASGGAFFDSPPPRPRLRLSSRGSPSPSPSRRAPTPHTPSPR